MSERLRRRNRVQDLDSFSPEVGVASGYFLRSARDPWAKGNLLASSGKSRSSRSLRLGEFSSTSASSAARSTSVVPPRTSGRSQPLLILPQLFADQNAVAPLFTPFASAAPEVEGAQPGIKETRLLLEEFRRATMEALAAKAREAILEWGPGADKALAEWKDDKKTTTVSLVIAKRRALRHEATRKFEDVKKLEDATEFKKSDYASKDFLDLFVLPGIDECKGKLRDFQRAVEMASLQSPGGVPLAKHRTGSSDSRDHSTRVS